MATADRRPCKVIKILNMVLSVYVLEPEATRQLRLIYE